MAEYGTALFAWTGWLTQFAVAFAGFLLVLRLAFVRRSRWGIVWKDWRRREVPLWFYRFWHAERESVALQERRVLLAGCGIRLDPRLYLAGRRALMSFCILFSLVGCAMNRLGPVPDSALMKMIFAAAIPIFAALYDGPALQALRRYRTDKIRRELSVVSSQLLYYEGSRLHLHGKLMKCLPLTRIIRSEMGWMLNEWYHDPDRALQRFKERLGTDEAFGFAEILRSLRLHESREVYELLRETVREYKARIDLAKDGRKESASYVLFVLAGTPILYTFQIFLYPWVQEAAKLFDSLNP